MLVIVVGRGHGGTRLMSEVLSKSGVFMGQTNESGDMVPPEDMYEAVTIAGRTVTMEGRHTWDFSRMMGDPPEEFRRLVLSYVRPLMESGERKRGWKLPETVLAFPWIQRMFPEAHYIHWVRDPRGSASGGHITDNLSRFGVQSEPASAPFLPFMRKNQTEEKRIESWVYHEEIVRASPRPKNFISVRFEDFVLSQDTELARLSAFLGIPLRRVATDPGHLRETAPCPEDVLERFGYRTQVCPP